MRILYHSAAPWLHTGYATCTEEIAPRIHNGDHEVALQPLSAIESAPIWWHGDELNYKMDERMKVYPAAGNFGLGGVADNFEDFEADLLFTHFDSWMEVARRNIPEMEIPYASYVIVDHDPAPDAVVEQVNNAQSVIAMSEYAEAKLQQKGVRPITIPHGVDTDIYTPLEGDDKPRVIEVVDNMGNEKVRNIDEITLFGMVAANHGDRKNIPNHLEAFKMFLENVDDEAVMYIHTEQTARAGYDLHQVTQELQIPKENLIWAQGDDYGDVGNLYLNNWYNAFDVMLNVSMGESWGLTITEAQSAGTPCIVTNFSSMPEQLGVNPRNPDDDIDWVDEDGYNGRTVGVAPHGLVVEPDAQHWREKVNSKQYLTNPDSIYQAMKYYYENEHLINQHGKDARQHVVDTYDWKRQVIPQFRELFNSIELTL